MDRLVRQHLEAYARLAHISDVPLAEGSTGRHGFRISCLLFVNGQGFVVGVSIDPTTFKSLPP